MGWTLTADLSSPAHGQRISHFSIRMACFHASTHRKQQVGGLDIAMCERRRVRMHGREALGSLQDDAQHRHGRQTRLLRQHGVAHVLQRALLRAVRGMGKARQPKPRAHSTDVGAPTV